MPSTGSPSSGEGRGPTGFCADSNLGIWLTETGGRFHPGLVFGAGSSIADQGERAGAAARDMGLSVWADAPINKHDVLASCPAQAIIDRNHSLDRIAKLVARLRHSDNDKSLPVWPDPDSIDAFFLGFLDRTVVSFYLILTKLSLRLKSRRPSAQEAEEDPSLVGPLTELFSFHEEYVRLLPEAEQLMTPLFWNDAELDRVRSTSLLPSVDQQRQLWTSEYESLILGEKIRGLSDDLHAFIRQHVTCLDYFWANTIVNSRSFPSTLLLAPSSSNNPDRAHSQRPSSAAPNESAPILLPGVDIFNHKRGSKVEWRSVPLDSLHLKSIEIVSLENQIPRGEQVFNNYGPKSTGELILGYGFALGEEDWKKSGGDQEETMVMNPDDFYPIKLSEPEEEQAYSPLIREIFSRFKPDGLLHHVRRDGQIPSLLMGQLRISMISSDEDLLLASNRLQDHLLLPPESFLDTFHTAMAHKLSWENELNCIDCLASLVKFRLNQLLDSHPFLPDADWDAQVRTPVKRMIQIYLNGQVQILKELLKVTENTFQIAIENARADGFHFDSDDDD
ncbi:hypothetical protein PTTG_02181 [Puccinia triticina 1-1 BBBD Race 1]|uniref:SET domain-containing protein n=1 Tax=Puccinia triticina (isolate 1-1 / race 1 (BBBD)) TaxID=630390 RepID=A0A180GEF2_PUCT1|nr:hypothetical protein PTTG_02181 [Puccinia triticina 1-1 BBBD Race 1]